jgi:hypothetical protein
LQSGSSIGQRFSHITNAATGRLLNGVFGRCADFFQRHGGNASVAIVYGFFAAGFDGHSLSEDRGGVAADAGCDLAEVISLLARLIKQRGGRTGDATTTTDLR